MTGIVIILQSLLLCTANAGILFGRFSSLIPINSIPIPLPFNNAIPELPSFLNLSNIFENISTSVIQRLFNFGTITPNNNANALLDIILNRNGTLTDRNANPLQNISIVNSTSGLPLVIDSSNNSIGNITSISNGIATVKYANQSIGFIPLANLTNSSFPKPTVGLSGLTPFQNISSPEVQQLFNLGNTSTSANRSLLSLITNTNGNITDINGNPLGRVNVLNSTNGIIPVVVDSSGNIIGRITTISNGTAIVANGNRTVGYIPLANLTNGLSPQLSNQLSNSTTTTLITNSGAEQVVTAIPNANGLTLIDSNGSVVGTVTNGSKNVLDSNGQTIGSLPAISPITPNVN